LVGEVTQKGWKLKGQETKKPKRQNEEKKIPAGLRTTKGSSSRRNLRLTRLGE